MPFETGCPGFQPSEKYSAEAREMQHKATAVLKRDFMVAVVEQVVCSSSKDDKDASLIAFNLHSIVSSRSHTHTISGYTGVCMPSAM